MRISAISKPNVTTARADMDVLTAARLMREAHVGDLVIVETRGVAPIPIGVVTDRDIVVGALAQGVDDLSAVHIGDLAPKACHVLGQDERIEEAIEAMQIWGVRRMPVVNERGELVGIVTYDDVVSWMLGQLHSLTRSFTNQRRREEIKRP